MTHQSTESAEEGVPEVAQREGEVLVEEVAQELAHPVVGPATVHEEESLEEPELRYVVVGGQDGLHALLPGDPHPDVSGCNWICVTWLPQATGLPGP